jgi:hypothetical protein
LVKPGIYNNSKEKACGLTGGKPLDKPQLVNFAYWG